MKIFPHFNKKGPKCPVCGKNTDLPCTLVPILGTEEDGICQADVVHIDCLNLVVDKTNENSIIYQVVVNSKKLENQS